MGEKLLLGLTCIWGVRVQAPAGNPSILAAEFPKGVGVHQSIPGSPYLNCVVPTELFTDQEKEVLEFNSPRYKRPYSFSH